MSHWWSNYGNHIFFSSSFKGSPFLSSTHTSLSAFFLKSARAMFSFSFISFPPYWSGLLGRARTHGVGKEVVQFVFVLIDFAKDGRVSGRIMQVFDIVDDKMTSARERHGIELMENMHGYVLDEVDSYVLNYSEWEHGTSTKENRCCGKITSNFESLSSQLLASIFSSLPHHQPRLCCCSSTPCIVDASTLSIREFHLHFLLLLLLRLLLAFFSSFSPA